MSYSRASCTVLLVRVFIVYVEYQVVLPLFRITSPGSPPQFLQTSPTIGATYFNPCSLSFLPLLLLGRVSSSAARSILAEKFKARPYITLGHSTCQRGKQHSGRVHSSPLRYIPLMLRNARSFTVAILWPRYIEPP